MKNIWHARQYRTKNAGQSVVSSLDAPEPRRPFPRHYRAAARTDIEIAVLAQQMNARMVGTTDDPIDSSGISPPDKAADHFSIDISRAAGAPTKFSKSKLTALSITSGKLEAAADVSITRFDDLRQALTSPPRPFRRLRLPRRIMALKRCDLRQYPTTHS